MKSCLLALSVLTALSGTAFADPIADRQASMKRISGHMRSLAPFAREEQPYDAGAVLTTLQALDAEMKAYDVEALFPAGSDAGDTKASPKIWEDRAGFQAAVDKFAGDIATAVAANPQDVASLTPLVAAIGSNCGACHGAWRK